jgi:hypothetical protein
MLLQFRPADKVRGYVGSSRVLWEDSEHVGGYRLLLNARFVARYITGKCYESVATLKHYTLSRQCMVQNTRISYI